MSKLSQPLRVIAAKSQPALSSEELEDFFDRRRADYIMRFLRTYRRVLVIQIMEKDRQGWLTRAEPADRWAVGIHEGGFLSYGPTLVDAMLAAEQTEDERRRQDPQIMGRG